jgi:O-antigen/teichoic acid export membrane protein
MTSARIIAKNSIVYLSANLLYFILLFFTVIYTARYLGASGYGILSIALAFAGTFGVIADLGISTLTTREVAKDKSLTYKYVGNIIVLRLILAIITVGMIFIIANLGNYSHETVITIYIASLSVIVGVFPGIFASIFQAYEKMEYPSVNMILTGIFLFCGTLFLIWKGLGVIEFAVLNVVAGVIVLGYSLIVYSWKVSLPKFEFDIVFWKGMIKESLPFGLISLSGMVYTYLDSIILSLLQPMEVVGWYSAAYRLMLVLLFIPTAVNVAVFPVMSKYFVSAHDALKLLYERYFKLMIIIGIPIGFGTIFLANKIIILIFGPAYTNSTIALQILIWTMVFTFAGASFVQVFMATNRQLLITKISLFCVVINLILNLILIPKFSYVGASVATVITEIILVSYLIKTANKLGYGISRDIGLNNVFKVILSSIIMSVFIWYFQTFNLLILIVSAILIYIGTLYLLGGIDKVDLEIINKITKGD